MRRTLGEGERDFRKVEGPAWGPESSKANSPVLVRSQAPGPVVAKSQAKSKPFGPVMG